MIINNAAHPYISKMNIGIIGLGDMGRLYAKAFAKAGYTVCGCDLPENRNRLEEELNPLGIKVLDNGGDVAEDEFVRTHPHIVPEIRIGHRRSAGLGDARRRRNK